MTLSANWAKASEIITNLSALESTESIQVLMLRNGYHLEETFYTRLTTGAEEAAIFVGGVWYLRDVVGNIVVKPALVKTRGELKRTPYESEVFTPSTWGELAKRWDALTTNVARTKTSSVHIVIAFGQSVAGVSLVPQWQGREGDRSGQIEMTRFEAQDKWEEHLLAVRQPKSLHTQYLDFSAMRGFLKI